MTVVCIYCEKEGLRTVRGVKAPLKERPGTLGICARHLPQMQREVETSWEELRKEIGRRVSQDLGKRRFPRLAVSLPVVGRAWQFGEGDVPGVIRDIGAGGVMVEFAARALPGSLLHLSLETRQGALGLNGTVVWSTAGGQGVLHGLTFREPKDLRFVLDLFLDEHIGRRRVRTRVLVIEDEVAVREGIAALLVLEGYEVLGAEGGELGLQLASAERPHAIFLDVGLPDLDGYEVCRRLHQNPATRGIPVVMVTGSGDPALNRRAYAAGAKACVPKPFRSEALIATLEAALAGKRRQRAPRTTRSPDPER
ncbi:MAG TPA: response regulator [Candidatus Methylomirabilis sp.]|nr:response regulator [Candidatus Methylomirabilis sp.]